MANNYDFDRPVSVRLTGLPEDIEDFELKKALGEALGQLEGRYHGVELKLVPNMHSEALIVFADYMSADFGVALLNNCEIGGTEISAFFASPHVKGEALRAPQMARGKKSPEKRSNGRNRYLARKDERKEKWSHSFA